MSTHTISLEWRRQPHSLDAQTYSRSHSSTLNGDQKLLVSAALAYKGDPDCADPEQLLLNALASCHLLAFLAVAEIHGYRVEQYYDTPLAHLEKNEEGRMAVTLIELTSMAVFSNERQQPDNATLTRLHNLAHRNCFIARSIRAQVSVTPALAQPAAPF